MGSYLKPINLAWFGVLITMAALSCSKALLSISAGVIGFAGAWYLLSQRSVKGWFSRPYIGWIAALFLLSVIAGLYTENMERWVIDMKGKVLLAGLPLALGILPSFSRKQYYLLFFTFILSTSIVAFISLVYYLADYAAINAAIEKNKVVDIAGSISHIYFGLLQAVAVLLGVFLIIKKQYFRYPQERIFLAVLTLFNIATLHLFASRTGMLALYMGLFVVALVYLFRKKDKGLGMGLTLAILILPMISYFTIPSFQNRVNVTLWDLGEFQIDGHDLTEKSLSQRFLVWQSSWKIFQESPLIGIGPGDIEDALASRSEVDQKRSKAYSRLFTPHNQYIEFLAGLGLLGFSLLVIACIFPLFTTNFSILLLAFITMFMSGMVFESLLERQIGITCFAVFMILLPDYQKHLLNPVIKNKTEKA